MKTIVIKTQAEMDALPSFFEELTYVEIRSELAIALKLTYGNSQVTAYGNSQVRAYGNSQVIAYDNSQVIAYGNSQVRAYDNSQVIAYVNSQVTAFNNSQVRAYDNSQVTAFNNSQVTAFDNSQVTAFDNSQVTAYLCATVFILSTNVTIESLLDNTHLIYRIENARRPDKVDATAKITEFKDIVTPTFEQWLERGYVVADGIHQKLVSQKTVGEISIYKVADLNESFVVKKGNKFAHGKTIKEAKNDLKYKLSDRDKSKYESWSLEESKTTDEMIEAYMTITGACSFGTKQFCESVKLKKAYTPREIIELTVGKYGNVEFSEFFN